MGEDLESRVARMDDEIRGVRMDLGQLMELAGPVIVLNLMLDFERRLDALRGQKDPAVIDRVLERVQAGARQCKQNLIGARHPVDVIQGWREGTERYLASQGLAL